MKLRVERFDYAGSYTLGLLYIDGTFECFVLEDTARGIESGGTKIDGQTAIPAGVYTVELTYSNRFKRVLPLIKDVPQFTGVRIHAGNSAEDTEGCLLVGRTCRKGWVGESRRAMDVLMHKLEVVGESVELEIV